VDFRSLTYHPPVAFGPDSRTHCFSHCSAGLYNGQEHFPAIDTAIEEIKADGGGGGGGGGGKKNPYGLIQGDVQAQNVSQKVEEQEARLHEMTVQYMHLTGRTDTTESKIKALEVLADDTAVKVKKLVSDVKQLQMEAPILGDRVSMLHQQHKEFSEKIEPKFAPLENDVSVLNGVLQLDKQNFVGKLSASLNLTSPLFTVIDNRLDTLDSDAGDLQKKVRDWCGGCDHLFERLVRRSPPSLHSACICERGKCSLSHVRPS
jgi:hypothetical protein